MRVNKARIVIAGAGYGGMNTAVTLSKKLGPNDASITLVNKHDYHYQTTWLHEPAAGTLEPDRTRVKIADVLNTSRVNFVQDEVLEVKTDEKKVMLKEGELEYDYLVLALGATAETFGIPGVHEHAFTKWTLNGARQVKDHIDAQFANYNNVEDKHEGLLTFVVAGAGFTGIEFIGELSERVPELCKTYDVPREKVRLFVVEAAPTALPGFDPELVEYAMNLLESRGVEFKINTPIKEVTASGVIVGEGEEIKAETVVWATGVRGNPVIEKSGFEAMRGRVKVNPDLRAPGHDDVFIIGDCALIINEEINRPYPPTAQIAMQMAKTCANNLIALNKGSTDLETFKFDNKGTVASLGGKQAIGVVGSRKIYGGTANFMKKMIDNRALFILGGPLLTLKKGKFPF
ncbi:NAD(P)/FAD-dependent oxidoreductase [Shouchella clausii]|uniref:NAD(P)/FAD-dependent oxidoreductase n=1 Tax=Shouchella rhizosphaerae TaxID=866786 RepID=A0ABZ2CXN5_9BACI|nr:MULTISPECIES: NAD(P)/FAD-dependent oxidoreductase [Shouchella]MCM3313673.1 NAD(P)/FAD-dependent oxidoreductase [Psychrobacillus sp. MER TA 17]ALA54208.1 NADH dehydrogenase [Shouchella clausii]KKI86371.1 NADH dehydrogenase [Shouchella clausii]MBU3229246.1 NAD(P)/FAD-dependent oxidoreductase [Shouchella clausii]MBU3265532.1 NAD(P)/FAD-dependent oxidoreductase [Shouchella clausii]